jgi:tetratricopeptide (TPR) repeat protein
MSGGDGMARLGRALEVWLAGEPRDPSLPARHGELADLLSPLIAERSPPAAGRRLGDFAIQREIGRGGMGIVYEALQVSLGRPVALKVLPQAATLGPAAVARFLREAATAARLDDPSVVKVYFVGTDAELPYFAMELCAGGPVTIEPRPVRESVAIALQVAGALAHAHAHGLVHRDVKPSNILRRADGSHALGDFGIARGQDSPGLTQTGALAGTPAYMAPEQIEGRPADARSDVFGLGATLYELLTLRPAFSGASAHEVARQVLACNPPDPRRLNPGLPADLCAVVQKALERNPGQRYQSAAELAADLRRFLDFEPVRACPVSRLGRLRRWARREPLRATLAATLLVAVPVITGLAGYLVAHGTEISAGQRKLLRDRLEQLVAEGFLIAVEDPLRAKATFAEALRIDPQDPEAIVGFAVTIKKERGRDALVPWIATLPEPLRTLPALRRLLASPHPYAMGDGPPPNDPLDLFLCSWFRRNERHYDGPQAHVEGLGFARMAVLRSPVARLAIHAEWAQAAAMARDADECRAAAATLLELWPQSWVALTRAGFALLHVDAAGSLLAYERALALHERNHVAHAGIAWLQAAAGDHEASARHNRRALEITPWYYPAAQSLGWDLEQLGKLQEAAACYRRAAELRPDGLRHHESLVRIYGKLGNETAVSAEHARWERVRQGR